MHLRIIIPLFCIFLLGACSQVELASHVAKTMPGSSKSEGDFKVGSSYKVNGKRYTPKEAYNYTETGIASWYGPNFHGKPTANGETFDMNELTAAHKTLQLPSLVRVTNLENGRSLIVRVNDRGPFKRGRIIDLSKRSAELLGFKNKGTAKVKIRVLGEESRAIAEAAKRGQSTRGVEVAMNENRLGVSRPQAKAIPASAPAPAPRQPQPKVPVQQAAAQDITTPVVESQSLEAPQIPGHIKDGNFLPDPIVKQMPVTPTNIYVQAGSFGNQDNAARLAQALQPFGQAKVYPAIVNGKQFYRVRLGPLPNVDQADTVLARLADSGRDEAIIIVD